MALTCQVFAGFNAVGGTGIVNSVEVDIAKGAPDLVSSPAPPWYDQVYCLRMAEAATAAEIKTASFTYAHDLMYAFYVRFADATPDSDITFFKVTSGTRVHLALTIKTDGKLEVIDASGGTHTSAAACFETDRWHLIEGLMHKDDAPNGYQEVWVDGVQKQPGGTDYQASAATSIELRWFGSNVGASSRTFYGSNLCGFTGASSSADFKGNYRVRQYQNRVNSATPDFGTAFESGTTADDCGENPGNDANYVAYISPGLTGVLETSHTDGSMTPGPKGDVQLSSATIFGCSWIARTSSAVVLLNNAHILHYGAGDGADGTVEVNLGESDAILHTRIYADAADANCPTLSEYFQYGIESIGVVTADAKLYDCWCNLLFSAPRRRVYCEGMDTLL